MKQASVNWREYFSSFWNYIDIIYMTLFLSYLLLVDRDVLQVPLKGNIFFEEFNNVDTSVILLNISLITIVFFKLMFFMQLIPYLGQLMMFLRECFMRMVLFMIFYSFAISYFSLVFELAGVDFSGLKNEYEHLGGTWVYQLTLFRNSIGDLNVPSY